MVLKKFWFILLTELTGMIANIYQTRQKSKKYFPLVYTDQNPKFK